MANIQCTPGLLIFKAMGMDYTPTTQNGIGCYRIRTNFADKNGHEWFIELHPYYGKNHKGDDTLGFYGDWYDISYEKEENERWEKEINALEKKYSTWDKAPWGERNEIKFPKQKNGSFESKLQYTHEGIIQYINEEFNAAYDQLIVKREMFDLNEIMCKSK